LLLTPLLGQKARSNRPNLISVSQQADRRSRACSASEALHIVLQRASRYATAEAQVHA